jgi:hypothetical protein
MLDGITGMDANAGAFGAIMWFARKTIDMVEDRQEAKGERLMSSRKCLSELREYLLNYQKSYPNEEIYIEITQPDPYPLADEPCPLELQQHEIDARCAEQRYLDALQAGLLRSGKS